MKFKILTETGVAPMTNIYELEVSFRRKNGGIYSYESIFLYKDVARFERDLVLLSTFNGDHDALYNAGLLEYEDSIYESYTALYYDEDGYKYVVEAV
jgi:hypothetical protein